MADLLGLLAVAILFRSIYHIAARSFYAQQDTKTPLYISLFTIPLNIFLAVLFTRTLHMGVYGLAWAQSIVAMIEVVILFVVMKRRIPHLFDKVFVHAVGRMASATGFMALICYSTVLLFQLQNEDQSFLASFPKFTVIVIVSISVYVMLSRWLKLEEAEPVVAKLKSVLFSKIR
jgi:putative peptidoglycan lipid II flippase